MTTTRSSLTSAEAVATAVTRYIGTQETWPTSAGYGNRVDLALINAVLSIQARFGSPQKDGSFNGVRGAVERYRKATSQAGESWMRSLAAFDELALIALTNKTKLNGKRSKSSAIIAAARAFTENNLDTRNDILGNVVLARAAYTGVKGLGPWTFEYFTMLIGEESTKPDIWITRFVSRAVGRQASHHEAFDAVKNAAAVLGCGSSALDHAIWSYGSTSRLRDMPEIAVPAKKS